MMYHVALLEEAKTHYSSDIAQHLMFINLNTLYIIGQNACLDY